MEARLELTDAQWNIPNLRERLSRAISECAAELEGRIKLLIQSTPATGRTYKRGAILKKATKALSGVGLTKAKDSNKLIAGSYFHRASAPGKPPAIDTGGLINSLYSQVVGELRARVAASKSYASILDSPDGLNRPFFQITVDEYEPIFRAKIQAVLEGN